MAITLPVSGQTNWDVPLNAALTGLDGNVTAINNVIDVVPSIETRVTGETWYRLVASSTASANVKAKADYVCSGTNDQAQIQLAIDAARTEGGGVVKLSSGSFNTSAPITLHPTVTLQGQHGDQIFNPNQLTVGSYIKPQNPFTGGAVIVLLGQLAGGYSNKSAEQRIFNITIDGSNSAANVHGIQASDYIHGVVLRDVAVKKVTGKGIYTFTENAAQPFSWTFNRVVVDNSADVGIHLINHSDCTMVDVVSIGAGGHNYVLSNMPNSRLVGCRAEWSDGHGFHITGNYGTGQGSGGILLSGCSTDRNFSNGIFIDATGNAPVVLAGLVTRRDGRNNNNGGGAYAGVAVAGAAVPVVIGNWACYPGVDDDGAGINSPQYGLRVSNSTLVQYDNVYLHANTAGYNDGGGNTTVRPGANVTYATGATNAPVRTFNNLAGFLPTVGGTLTGTLNNTGNAAAATVYGSLVAADTFDRFRIYADGKLEWGSGALARDITLFREAAGTIRTSGYFAMNSGQADNQFTIWGGTKNALLLGSVGGGLAIKEGTNARSGVVTLVAGSAVVANTSVAATTRIQLTSQSDGGTPGWLRVSARTAGTSFTITSSSNTDTSTVAWFMVESG